METQGYAAVKVQREQCGRRAEHLRSPTAAHVSSLSIIHHHQTYVNVMMYNVTLRFDTLYSARYTSGSDGCLSAWRFFLEGEAFHMAQTLDGTRWLSQQEIAAETGFSITKVRNVVQVLASVDQITVRIDPQDGKSRLVRESDLGLVTKALNRGA